MSVLLGDFTVSCSASEIRRVRDCQGRISSPASTDRGLSQFGPFDPIEAGGASQGDAPRFDGFFSFSDLMRVGAPVGVLSDRNRRASIASQQQGQSA
jgi:hypothetical protein